MASRTSSSWAQHRGFHLVPRPSSSTDDGLLADDLGAVYVGCKGGDEETARGVARWERLREARRNRG